MSTESLLSEILAELKKLNAAADRRAAAANGGSSAVATNAELDGPFGDETIKFDPRDWQGDSFKGAPMSRCPADYLDMLASSLDYFAKKNEGKLTDKGKPKSDFDRRSAARARGWAQRVRGGWKPRAAPIPNDDADDFGDHPDPNEGEEFGYGGGF